MKTETFNKLCDLRTMMLNKAELAEDILTKALFNDSNLSQESLNYSVQIAESEMELAMSLFREFQAVWKESLREVANEKN